MKNLLAASLVIVTSTAALAAEVSTDDFAAGYALELTGNGPMYVLQLPPEVYRTVRRADLGDILVFNGAGEAVPHSLRPIEADPQTVSSKAAVPFFPLYAGNTLGNQGDLALHVTRNAAGTILDIQSAPAGGAQQRRISGYLLDLSVLQKTVRELEFFWRQDRESSIFAVTLQQSDDLEHWQSLVSRATLADLQYGGQKIERRKVSLPYQSKKYLKITWEGDQPLELSAVSGYTQAVASSQPREWVDLDQGMVQKGDSQVVIDYRDDYHMPVTAAQLRFPQVNVIARLALQSRADDKAAWQTRCEQVFYSLALESSTLLQNEPCTFPVTGDQKWRLVVKEDGAGLAGGKGTPVMQLGVRPSELVFLGRGGPPFVLAFGSGRLAGGEMKNDSQMLAQAMKTEGGNKMTGQARISKKLTLGGEEALQPPAPARPWKKWLLWTVLVLGVGLLAGMAKSLIGEIKKEENAGK